MVKVVGPMFSLGASGSFSNDVTFQCGEVLRKKKFTNKLRNDWLNEQQQNFQMGAYRWSHELSAETKAKWALFGIVDTLNVMCDHYALALPFLGLVAIEALPVSVLGVIWMTKYDLYMSYYLTLGPNGWPNYPDPPPIGWRP